MFIRLGFVPARSDTSISWYVHWLCLPRLWVTVWNFLRVFMSSHVVTFMTMLVTFTVCHLLLTSNWRLCSMHPNRVLGIRQSKLIPVSILQLGHLEFIGGSLRRSFLKHDASCNLKFIDIAVYHISSFGVMSDVIHMSSGPWILLMSLIFPKFFWMPSVYTISVRSALSQRYFGPISWRSAKHVNLRMDYWNFWSILQ